MNDLFRAHAPDDPILLERLRAIIRDQGPETVNRLDGEIVKAYPLEVAVTCGHVKCVRLLLAAKADPRLVSGIATLLEFSVLANSRNRALSLGTLLLDHGLTVPCVPPTYFVGSEREVFGELATYQKQLAGCQLARRTLERFVVRRTRLGRDMAHMLGHSVWATRAEEEWKLVSDAEDRSKKTNLKQ